MPSDLRSRLRWLIFPGMNLHARQRYRRLPALFGAPVNDEDRRVLDAGCGNGMLSYRSYLKGNRVTGVSIKRDEVAKCRALFNEYLGIPEERLRFEAMNLHELDFAADWFDEIVCAEVIEHIRNDARVCRSLWRVLKPGGVLHLTTPNAAHPYNRDFPLDLDESGGHVRPGYTPASFAALLEPIGFRIAETGGLGGPVRQFFNRRIKEVQGRRGVLAGAPLFAASLPFMALDDLFGPPATPFSLYVRAVKD